MEKMTYNVNEVAQLLGISSCAAYQLCRSEGFPRIKVGKRILIPIAAFHEWVASQTRNQGEVA